MAEGVDRHPFGVYGGGMMYLSATITSLGQQPRGSEAWFKPATGSSG